MEIFLGALIMFTGILLGYAMGQVKSGPIGPQGVPGEPGPQGPQGPQGPTGTSD